MPAVATYFLRLNKRQTNQTPKNQPWTTTQFSTWAPQTGHVRQRFEIFRSPSSPIYTSIFFYATAPKLPFKGHGTPRQLKHFGSKSSFSMAGTTRFLLLQQLLSISTSSCELSSAQCDFHLQRILTCTGNTNRAPCRPCKRLVASDKVHDAT